MYNRQDRMGGINLAQFGHPKAFELSENGFKWLGDYEITADEGAYRQKLRAANKAY